MRDVQELVQGPGGPRGDARRPDMRVTRHGDLRLTRWADLRLTLRIVALTFRAQAEYRAEFLLKVAFGVAWQVSIIVFAAVLLGRFPGMGGWPSDAVLLIAAMRMLSHGLFELFCGRATELSTIVQAGKIDAYLLRPLPVYRQVQLSIFPSNALGDLLVGVSMFTSAVVALDTEWTPLRVAYVGAAVAGGALMEGAIFTLLSALQLRLPAGLSWSRWVEELLSTFGNYPLKILPGVVNGAFTFILPLAFVAYFPAATLTGNTSGLGVPAALAAAAPLAGLAGFVGSRLLWNFALRHYTGVNG
ncbi:ABC transporter permease [Actinomadura litoris]|uniref:ABC transporter permease n=1 Tax=Actinomadura litoris TaxID=2678616 RepID=UPI001FA7F291|nr:ABC-2 family transporter protein [Actinomadura litoris]